MFPKTYTQDNSLHHTVPQAALRARVWRSPFGPLELCATERGLARVGFPSTAAFASRWAKRLFGSLPVAAPPCDTLLDEAERQLQAYFDGTLQAFDLPLDLRGTSFQLAVWRALCAVPWGTITSYRALAAQISHPTAVRAVGAANAANPVSIIVPCHRVVASDGKLRGYSGGVEHKARLLAIEGLPATSALR